jgi:ATP-dependent helicase/nuclease subunit A
LADDASPGPLSEPRPAGVRQVASYGAGQTYGTAFHRLMEHLALQPDETPERLRRALRLPPAGFDALWAQAQRLLGDPSLARYFDAKSYRRALNEVSIITATGELRRLDRVVEYDDEVWVLDYKTGSYAALAGTPLESEYRTQVAGYCAALSQVYAGKVIRGELLFADGSRLEV